MKKISLLILTGFFLLICLPAQAQGGLGEFEVELRLINQTPAVRNPRFITDTEIFDLRVADTNRQLVGMVKDLLIGPDGKIRVMSSDITRVGRERRTVEHNYDQITYYDEMSAFEIPLIYESDNQISPQAQAVLSPGISQSDLSSLRAMKGAEVFTIDGRWLGKVTDVILDEDVTGLEALVVEDVPGARRYDKIAIPFHQGLVSIRHEYGRVEFRLTSAAGQIIMEYGRAQK